MFTADTWLDYWVLGEYPHHVLFLKESPREAEDLQNSTALPRYNKNPYGEIIHFVFLLVIVLKPKVTPYEENALEILVKDTLKCCCPRWTENKHKKNFAIRQHMWNLDNNGI